MSDACAPREQLCKNNSEEWKANFSEERLRPSAHYRGL